MADAGIVAGPEDAEDADDEAPVEMTGVGAAVMIRIGGSTGTGGSGVITSGRKAGGLWSVGTANSSAAAGVEGAATGANGMGVRFFDRAEAARVGGFWVAGACRSAGLAGFADFADAVRETSWGVVVGAVPNAFPGFGWISFGVSFVCPSEGGFGMFSAC